MVDLEHKQVSNAASRTPTPTTHRRAHRRSPRRATRQVVELSLLTSLRDRNVLPELEALRRDVDTARRGLDSVQHRLKVCWMQWSLRPAQ